MLNTEVISPLLDTSFCGSDVIGWYSGYSKATPTIKPEPKPFVLPYDHWRSIAENVQGVNASEAPLFNPPSSESLQGRYSKRS